jgi:hypothetical protein
MAGNGMKSDHHGGHGDTAKSNYLFFAVLAVCAVVGGFL